jgi:hypothetical protein
MGKTISSKSELLATAAAVPSPSATPSAGGLPAKWDGRASFSVDELPEIFPISRAGAYAAIAKGEINSIRIGRRVIIPRGVIEKMLAA